MRRRHSRTIASALTVFALMASAVLAMDQPARSAGSAGSMDPSFGTGGSLTTSINSSSAAKAIVVQPDGRLIAAGLSSGLDRGGFTFARYNADGSLDTTFGGDGVVSDIFVDSATSHAVWGLTLQDDGKIIGVGDNGFGFALARLDGHGSLDASFGTDGLVTTVGPGRANGVAVQPDGKIIAAGNMSGNITLARYNSDGSLDTGFGADGLVTLTAIPGFNDEVREVIVQPDGKILAAGLTDAATAAHSNAILVRYNADGSLDTSFDTDGIAITDLGVAGIHALALLPDGKIVAAGYATDGDWDWAVLRYNADGSLDTSFDTDGVVTTGFGSVAGAEGLVVESDGQIVVTGWIRTSTNPWTYEFALVRYQSDGSLDTDFGTDGIVRTNPSIDFAAAMAHQSDGKVVVAGDSSNRQFALARFLTGGNIVPIAVGDGPFALFPGETVTGSVLDNDSDGDGDVLTAVKTSDPAQGTVTLEPDGSFAYTADADFGGTDSFTYVANDGIDNSNAVEVLLERIPNTAPQAMPDGIYAVTSGETLNGNVLSNDSDANGDPLVAIAVSDPQHGSLMLYASGAFTYVPDIGFSGFDSFTYTANDGTDDSNIAQALIEVEAAPVDPDPPDPVPADVGLVDPMTGRWHLRDSNGSAVSFYYGNPGDIPFMGDWDCDGIDTPGLFRQSDAYAYLRNANTQGTADVRFFFGNPSDVPLPGDFNDDGCDTLSIYRPSESRFYIINHLGQNNGGLGAADFSFRFGDAGDQPVVADWDGDGIDEIGLHRETNGFFYWRDTLTTGNADGAFFFGDPGDRFVAGDWGIIDEFDTPAVFRPTDVTFFFRHDLAQGAADAQFTWNAAEPQWLPVAGRFGIG